MYDVKHDRVLKTQMLLHINHLFENVMEKRVLDISLLQTPASRHMKYQSKPDGSFLNNMTECVFIMYAISLLEIFSKMCFVPSTISYEFILTRYTHLQSIRLFVEF
jgi:hypothetical protein